jgi:hypothetical protein
MKVTTTMKRADMPYVVKDARTGKIVAASEHGWKAAEKAKRLNSANAAWRGGDGSEPFAVFNR